MKRSILQEYNQINISGVKSENYSICDWRLAYSGWRGLGPSGSQYFARQFYDGADSMGNQWNDLDRDWRGSYPVGKA
jgi:hypothetical protein